MLKLIVLCLALLPALANAELGVHLKAKLGKPAPAEFEALVAPDGSGAPHGSGTAIQGKPLYETQCAACHGVDGKMPGNAIAGGVGSLTSGKPNKTVGSYWPYATTLFDYINRAMPYGNEKSLSADEVYAITAYVLYLSDIVEDDQILNDSNLAEVEMPNKDGFKPLPDFKPQKDS